MQYVAGQTDAAFLGISAYLNFHPEDQKMQKLKTRIEQKLLQDKDEKVRFLITLIP